jgi:Holliday junction resolvasome RuvABC endonuclease subunit
VIIVGLDLSSLTNAGIAVLTDGRPTLLRSVGHGGHNGASHAHRSRRIVSQTRAVMGALSTEVVAIRQTHIDLAVIEDQLEHGPMLPSALDRSALWWGVYSALLARKIPVAVVNPSTLKVWVTGKGNATKATMLTTVRGWYPDASILNAADALALATVGAFHLGDPMPFDVVKTRHETALAKVEWPVSV